MVYGDYSLKKSCKLCIRI